MPWVMPKEAAFQSGKQPITTGFENNTHLGSLSKVYREPVGVSGMVVFTWFQRYQLAKWSIDEAKQTLISETKNDFALSVICQDVLQFQLCTSFLSFYRLLNSLIKCFAFCYHNFYLSNHGIKFCIISDFFLFQKIFDTSGLSLIPSYPTPGYSYHC